jgi:hypothetical protein
MMNKNMHIFQHTHGLVHKIDIRQIVWQFFFCIITHDGNKLDQTKLGTLVQFKRKTLVTEDRNGRLIHLALSSGN